MRHLLTLVHPCGAEQLAVVPSVADCLDLTLHRFLLCFLTRNNMANRFGPDILIQGPDPKKAALFYVNRLGFENYRQQPEDDRPPWQAHQLVHRAWPVIEVQAPKAASSKS
jgi:hypothetical protein